MSKLAKEIEIAINRSNAEIPSDTPDFILAEFLEECLMAWNRAVKRRETYYGRIPEPSEVQLPPPQDCNKEQP